MTRLPALGVWRWPPTPPSQPPCLGQLHCKPPPASETFALVHAPVHPCQPSGPACLQGPDLEAADRVQDGLVRRFWPFFHPVLQARPVSFTCGCCCAPPCVVLIHLECRGSAHGACVVCKHAVLDARIPTCV